MIKSRQFCTAKSLRIREVSRLKTAKARDKFLGNAFINVPKEDLDVQCYPSQCGHRGVMLRQYLACNTLWPILYRPYIMVNWFIMKIGLTVPPGR